MRRFWSEVRREWGAVLEGAPLIIACAFWVLLFVCFLSAACFVVAAIGTVLGRLL